MSRRRTPTTRWQNRCLAQLKASASQAPDTLSVVGQSEHDSGSGLVEVRFRLKTTEISRQTGGLPLKDIEEFVLAIGPGDDHPPSVYVDHVRFLGHPHVLSGFLFCLYLDESREWDPVQGLNGYNGVLNRLWRFLEKAANAEFDASEALYHAVGGLPHITRGATPLPPIVVRDLPEQHGTVASAWLVARSPWCFELKADRPADDPANSPEHVPVFFPDRDLPFGAGSNYLSELIERVAHGFSERPPVLKLKTVVGLALGGEGQYGEPPCPTPRYRALDVFPAPITTNPAHALLGALTASASRKPPGSSQLLILAVPHPIGGPRHLIAVHFEPKLGDRLRALAADRQTPVVTFDQARIDRATPLQWCYLSDERAEVTRRRDVGRPVAAYRGKHVLVWGLGGLGAWIAEYVLRAGATRVTICDHGRVTGGLLVRQNYVDLDIGAAKADRLLQRLRDIAPDADVNRALRFTDAELKSLANEADLIIDATINRVVARRLDSLARQAGRTCVIAQVATDVRTGSLGLAVVTGPQTTAPLSKVDNESGRAVADDASLEAYRIFWDEPGPGDEFVPTRGCSLPTFHGSAADLAAVAGSLTTLIASHLDDGATGTHLLALPHTGVSPAHLYLPASGA